MTDSTAKSTLASIDGSPRLTWFDAFWPLALLSLASMGQSTETLLGRDSRYAVYLRSSPIFCIAIIISFYAHLAAWAVSKVRGQKAPLLDFIMHLAPERTPYADEDYYGPEKGSLTAVALKFLSAMILPAATMFSQTMLVSMRDAFWTCVWGWSFLLSIWQTYLMDLQLLLGQFDHPPSGPPSTPVETDAGTWTNRHFLSLDTSLFGAACAAHSYLVFFLIGNLWPSYPHPYFNSSWAHPPPPGTTVRGPNPLYINILIIAVMDIVTLACAILPVARAVPTYYMRHTYSPRQLMWEVIYGIFSFASSWTFVYYIGIPELILDCFWMACFVGVPVGMYFALLRWGDLYPKLGRTLLLRWPRRKESSGSLMDKEACLYFVGFLHTSVLAVLYYTLKYRQAETAPLS